MRRHWAQRGTPLALALASFVLAFVQRPGVVVADTKINLYVSSSRFLSDVVSAWNPSGSLGAVFSGQYSGYLFPMAPFYALGHAAGYPNWFHDITVGTSGLFSSGPSYDLVTGLGSPQGQPLILRLID